MSKPLVLVVDDNAVHLKVCELLLDKFGYLSCCIDSGHEALDIFSATDGFGAVLMDWRMPEIDGIECMQRMREVDDKRGKHTPIIAVTASVMSGDREFCLASGMDDYLSKPFVALELQQVLKRHIGTTSGVTSGLVSA